MPKLILIALGGCAGAVSRYLLSGLAHRWTGSTFPLGTLLVNVLGCLAIGALMSLIQDRSVFGPNVRFLLVVGFLGSFTTFSAFGYETMELLSDRQLGTAALNAFANCGLGLAAVLLGRILVRGLLG